MSQATFHAPRRKRKVYETYESPFPIPLSHDCHMKDFRICQAEIINNYVIVRRLEEIELLYGKTALPFLDFALLPEPVLWIAEVQQRHMDAAYSVLVFNNVNTIRYQQHVEWAKGLLEAQGLDTSSISKLLGDYTNPINLPEDKNETADSGDHKPDLEPASADALFPAGEENRILERDSVYDPLAKYNSEKMEIQDTCIEPDRGVLEKMYCHRHDDFIIHCGCKAERQTGKTEAAVTSVYDGGEREYVLVEELDSGPEVEDLEEERGEMQKKRLVCRKNPFRIFEYLQLSREEAFFLVYALGCLSVTYKKEPLPIQKLWDVFRAAQPNFPTSYMAYQHFRSKGWVPKVGLKYGTDLLLYRKGPPFYHASYSVIVELADENCEGSPLRPLTWRSLSGLNRTTMNVSKELLICYLIKPLGFTEIDMNTPECIKRFKVQEVIVSRWISSRERMEHDEL